MLSTDCYLAAKKVEDILNLQIIYIVPALGKLDIQKRGHKAS